MTDTEKMECYKRALELACKWMRQNPPGDLDQYLAADYNGESGYLEALIHTGCDPEGKLWQKVFLTQAINEINNELNF